MGDCVPRCTRFYPAHNPGFGNDTGILGPIPRPGLSSDCRAFWNSFNQKDNTDWNQNSWESELLEELQVNLLKNFAFNLEWINTKRLESSWCHPGLWLQLMELSTATFSHKNLQFFLQKKNQKIFFLYSFKCKLSSGSKAGDCRAQSQSIPVHQVFKAKVQKFLQRFYFPFLEHKMPMLHLESAGLTLSATLGMNILNIKHPALCATPPHF